MSFDDGSFVMASEGKKPATLTVSGDTAELELDGKLTGTYLPAAGNEVAFKVGKAQWHCEARGIPRATSARSR